MTQLVSVPRFGAPAIAVCTAHAPYDSCDETVIVRAGPRTAVQWFRTVAAGLGLALLAPLSILVIGLPMALAVQGILGAATWLMAFLGR